MYESRKSGNHLDLRHIAVYFFLSWCRAWASYLSIPWMGWKTSKIIWNMGIDSSVWNGQYCVKCIFLQWSSSSVSVYAKCHGINDVSPSITRYTSIYQVFKCGFSIKDLKVTLISLYPKFHLYLLLLPRAVEEIWKG